MHKFGTRRFLLIAVVLALLVAALTTAVVLPGTAAGAATRDSMTLQQIHDIMAPELSGQKALDNVAYVYRGWRNTGGPWFDQVETWIEGQMADLGFTEGEGSSDYSYWIQSDYKTGSVWVPQYLSMQIVGAEGDADPANPAAYHFDHPAIDTFDPTSPYYPAYMTQQWVIDHQRTPAEEAINDRCHLATSSAFTAPMDTPVDEAETPEGGAIIADVVDVGTVTGSGSATRTWSNHSSTSLAGKILFSSTASISSLMTLASQQSAKAVMSASALSSYSDPVIDGVEVYPNNVRFSGGGSSAAPTRITLNISREDVRFLTALCAKYDQTGGFPQMKLFAIGSSVPYSVAPDTTTMLHTLIVEIKGSEKPDERIMEMAHVQEPGAEDNASGVGQQLEMLRATKHLIDTGALPRPRRTMTFMWGNEMTMSALYKASHPAEYNKIVAAFSNDMVGADQATTGAVYVLDKMPDPSAQYAYQTDVLAGTTAPAPEQFLRAPDTHTLWGAGSLKWYPYTGHFLTDLYFESGKIMEKDSPTFDTRYRLKPSPWEGGSDAQPFLWNTDVVDGVTVRNPIPALATFFFTDYTYHSSMDTMKAVSAQRLHDVGVMSGVFAYYRADADLKSARETVDVVKAAADQRFGWEEDNAKAHLLWALVHPYGEPATTDAALHEAYEGTGNSDTRSIGESQLLREWDTWYEEAVTSARTMFSPGDSTPAYHAHETAAVAAVAADAAEAQANAAHLLAVFHFSTDAVAVDGGATCEQHAGRRTDARRRQRRSRRRHRHALLRRRQDLARRVHHVRGHQRLHAARRRRREDGVRPVPGFRGQHLRPGERHHQARHDRAYVHHRRRARRLGESLRAADLQRRRRRRRGRGLRRVQDRRRRLDQGRRGDRLRRGHDGRRLPRDRPGRQRRTRSKRFGLCRYLEARDDTLAERPEGERREARRGREGEVRRDARQAREQQGDTHRGTQERRPVGPHEVGDHPRIEGLRLAIQGPQDGRLSHARHARRDDRAPWRQDGLARRSK